MDSSNCTICRERVNENPLCCNFCDNTIHITCSRSLSKLNFQPEIFDAIQRVGFSWSCEKCKVPLESFANSFKLIKIMFSEMKNKIDKLEKSASKNESEKIESTSYASVTKENMNVVVVIPKHDEQKSDLSEKVREKINPVTTKIVGMRQSKNNKIVIKSSEPDKIKFLNSVKKNMGENYDVQPVLRKNPRLKIIGLINIDNNSESDIINAICKQNESLICDPKSLKLIKIYENKKFKNAKNIILECDEISHGAILKSEKLCIFWSRCRVYDAINIVICFKCSRFGHIESECKNEICCGKCSGAHKFKECNSNFNKCINCVEAAKKLHLKLNVNHPTWSKSCDSLQNKFKFLHRNK
jgi:hypothetical protein